MPDRPLRTGTIVAVARGRRLTPRWRLAALIALLVPLLLAPASAARAQAAAPESLPGATVELRASDEQVATFVAAPPALDGPHIASTTFIVTYSGFSPEAQAAFQRAVDIWSSLLASPEPIRVHADWTPLGAGILGSAGPNGFWGNFSGAPLANTWYPVALANKLHGSDLDGGSDDIVAFFSSSFASSFYFGSDTTPAGKINFTSVVLHELGHGLGFSGSMRVSGGSGSWGSGTAYPTIYDRFAQDGAGQSLLNTGAYPNPSTQLRDVLQGGSVWFAGSQAMAAAGGARPKLFAPNPWQSGSSYAHLDETTYAAGNPNSLMTPALASGETIYSPGPIALGLLQDLGWSLDAGGGVEGLTVTTSGGGSVIFSGSGPVNLTPLPDPGKTFVAWTVDGTYRGWAVPLSITVGDGHTVNAAFALTTTFGDVGSGRADYAAIVALATRGTIRGYNASSYGPDDGVQRAQMAALIARATGAGPGTPPTTLAPPACLVAGTWDCEDWGNSFTDRSGDPNLWRNAGALQHYGVALGYQPADCAAKGRTFPCYGPSDPVTYAETITFITRAMVAKGYWTAQPGAPQPYAGVPAVFAVNVATFTAYTGGIPAPPADWNAQSRRGWFARALWAALTSYWGVDQAGRGGYVP